MSRPAMPDEFPIGPVCRDEACPYEGEHRHDNRDGSIWRLTAQLDGRLEKVGEHEYLVATTPRG